MGVNVCCCFDSQEQKELVRKRAEWKTVLSLLFLVISMTSPVAKLRSVVNISWDTGVRPISFWLGQDGVAHATFNESFGLRKK